MEAFENILIVVKSMRFWLNYQLFNLNSLSIDSIVLYHIRNTKQRKLV
jgi:hypothetical protein